MMPSIAEPSRAPPAGGLMDVIDAILTPYRWPDPPPR